MAGQTDEPNTTPDSSTALGIERTFLAHERTLLAWVRTSTSLITFGFSIQQFFRIARAGAAKDYHFIGPEEFGFLMMAIGLMALTVAVWQDRSDLQALQARYSTDFRIPRSHARMLAALIALLGILGLLSMSLRH